MTTVLICKDGREDSVVGNVALARTIAATGDSVCILFVGDALKALHTGTLEWSANFLTREARTEVIAGAEREGIPLADRSRDPRWSDSRALVTWAGAQPDVRVVACPVWTRLLGASDLPDHVERITDADLVSLLRSAETVLGGY